jgi:HlyD family secretion protein
MEKEIEIRTEEVNELLTAVPKWIIRWGVTLIFLIMVAIVTLSFFIKYPDTLSAKITITTLNPPINLLAKTSGKIIELNVKNNQVIKKGEVMAVLENTANYKHVLKVSLLLDTFQTNLKLKKRLPTYIRLDTFQVGELTIPFLQFLKSYNDYKLFSETNPQVKEITIIDKELETYSLLFKKYQAQENLTKEEFDLIEKDFIRYRDLYKNNAISTKEFEDKNREYIRAKQNYETIKINSLNNKITISSLEKNKLQLQLLEVQETEKYLQQLTDAIQTLKSQIDTWEQTYLFISPIDGSVSLYSYWAKNQNIKQGEEVLGIVPSEKQEIIAKLMLPVQNSGKLKIGQKVNIKLTNYAYQEYGMLQGVVRTISTVPQNENYAIEVALPDKLRTTYKKRLDYKEEMQGTAEIITEELSVFDRIFYQFRKLIIK